MYDLLSYLIDDATVIAVGSWLFFEISKRM